MTHLVLFEYRTNRRTA